MKTKLLLLVSLFCLQMAFSQSVTFSINGTSNEITKTDVNHIISAKWNYNRFLEIHIKQPSKENPNRFNTLSLYTYGREEKSYPIGSEALDMENKANNLKDTGEVSCSVFSRSNGFSANSNRKDASGFIKITKIEGNKVSGMFVANIAENRIFGNFNDIEVQSW